MLQQCFNLCFNNASTCHTIHMYSRNVIISDATTEAGRTSLPRWRPAVRQCRDSRTECCVWTSAPSGTATAGTAAPPPAAHTHTHKHHSYRQQSRPLWGLSVIYTYIWSWTSPILINIGPQTNIDIYGHEIVLSNSPLCNVFNQSYLQIVPLNLKKNT